MENFNWVTIERSTYNQLVLDAITGQSSDVPICVELKGGCLLIAVDDDGFHKEPSEWLTELINDCRDDGVVQHGRGSLVDCRVLVIRNIWLNISYIEHMIKFFDGDRLVIKEENQPTMIIKNNIERIIIEVNQPMNINDILSLIR